MNPMTHSLFPIELHGGNQRLLNHAIDKHTIRVQLGRRTCTVCERESPYLRCHHRALDAHGEGKAGETCGGRTQAKETKSNAYRRGEVQSVRMDEMVEDARIRLGIDRLPAQVKCQETQQPRSKRQKPSKKAFFAPVLNSPFSETVRFATT